MPATAPSKAARWTTRLLADERNLLLARIAADQPVLWLSPMPVEAGSASTGHTLLELWPGVPPVLTGDLDLSATEWPFLDDSLGQVVLQHAGECGMDQAALIDEALRVLRPEGSLWLLGCGRFGWPRLRLAWPGLQRRRALCAPAPLAWQRRLADRGCVDIVASALCRDAASQQLVARPRAGWSSPLLLLHARKRRGATILNVRRRLVFEAQPMHALGASPASRSGLAA